MKIKAVSGIMLTLFIFCMLSANMIEITVAQADHDIAVVSVTAPAKAVVGSLVSISVEVANEGEFFEVANVAIRYNTTYIDSYNVLLLVGESITVLFSWGTTGVAQGVYILNATATILGDENLTDNWNTTTILITSSAPVISATVDIDPDTLNLRSMGKWITAYIQLPEEYNPEEIDATTILLNETIQPVLDPKYEFVTNSSEYLIDYNEDGILERMVKFDRAEVMALLSVGEATLTITGEVDGTPFEGTDTVKVLFPGDVDDDDACMHVNLIIYLLSFGKILFLVVGAGFGVFCLGV